MSSNSNVICKITCGTDIRRFTTIKKTLATTGGWKYLAKRVIDLFELGNKEWRTLKLTYLDDEGDRITISSDEELSEAISLAIVASPPVLRLSVVETPTGVVAADDGTKKDGEAEKNSSTQTTASAQTNTNGSGAAPDAPNNDSPVNDTVAFLQTLASQLPSVVHQLPPSLRSMLPQYELDVAATIAANAANAAGEAAKAANESARAQRAAAWRASRAAAAGFDANNARDNKNTPAAGVGVHPGVTCDKSGMSPIVGDRYHLIGHDYDLCASEYHKLSDEEKAKFERIPPPIVKNQPPSSSSSSSSTPWTTSNAGGAAMGGPRLALGIHPGVVCDRSGMCPIVGMRYNLKGHNYDLCQSEFDKLNLQEKNHYVAIPPPVLPPTPAAPFDMAKAAAAAASAGDVARAAFGGGGCGGSGSWGHRRGGPFGGSGGGGFGGAHGGRHWGPRGEHVNGPDHGPKLSARFVRDVTIFDGTQMAPSTPFTKIWRLKNNGEVPWPPGTKMMFTGGDSMQHEMEVPLSRGSPVQPGEEVDVAVTMTAPAELGRYLGYWRLTGPMGRRKFGHRVWCHIQVVDPNAADPLLSGQEGDNAAVEGLAEAIEREVQLKKKKAVEAEDGTTACGGMVCDQMQEDEDEDEAETAAAIAAVAAAEGGLRPPTDKEKDTLAAVAAPPPAAMEVEGPAVPMGEAVEAVESAAVELVAKSPTTVHGNDGNCSDDGSMILVDEAEAEAAEVEAKAKENDHGDKGKGKAAAASPPIPEPDTTTAEGIKAALASMGFVDPALVEAALVKHGADLGACAQALASAAEWEPLLDDLEEMGFGNRELNKVLMLEHHGNVKRTVKALVEDA